MDAHARARLRAEPRARPGARHPHGGRPDRPRWYTDDVLPPFFRAAVLKVVTDGPGTTHSNPRLRTGLEQLRFLTERGVGAERRHDHLARCLVPRLLAGGATQEEIDQMTVHHARRLLTPAPEVAA